MAWSSLRKIWGEGLKGFWGNDNMGMVEGGLRSGNEGEDGADEWW